MKIEPIKPQPTFGYSHPLKTAFKKGLLPTVERDLFGNVLTLKNVSIDHIQPVASGGKTILDNITLMTREANNNRGVRPLDEMITIKQLKDYLSQFLGVKNKYVDGNEYVKLIQNRFNVQI